MRGIDKAAIFRDDADRRDFLQRLERLVKLSRTGLFAFSLMPNHVHLLLKSGPDGLSALMRRLLSGYAQHFNRRHKRIGPLFQGRYKSIICEEEAYFDNLVAYIHLNPLKAGILPSLDQLAVCPWNGHGALLGRMACDWLDREYVLQRFGNSENSACEAYLDFIRQEMAIDREKELSGGGLVRSRGGWSKVVSMRKRGDTAVGDDRILGSDRFVSMVLDDAGSCKDVPQPESGRIKQFEGSLLQECEKAGISLAFLRSGSRSGGLPELRRSMAWMAVRELGLSLAETARHLGVTTSAVRVMLDKAERMR